MAGALAQDAAVAWRGLVRRPFYAVASVVMLALAIGANATAFGIFYGFLLRPLPYHNPQRLILVGEYTHGISGNGASMSASGYGIIRKQVPALAQAGLWGYGGGAPVMIGHHPQVVSYSRATPSFFRTLGVVPLLGRLPSLAAGRADGPHELLISDKFWHSAYDGNRSVLAHRLIVDGVNYRIVGVMPRDYAFREGADVKLPLIEPITGIRDYNLDNVMIARLPAGQSRAALQPLLARALPLLARATPPQLAGMFRGVSFQNRRLRPWFTAGTSLRSLPWIVQGTALLLLLLAIANAANLALVRQRGRLHEFALRRVLGGTSGTVMRLLIAEQLPLLVVTTILALVLAWLGTRFMYAHSAVITAPPFRFGFGWDEIIAVLVLSLASLILITLVPAIVTARLNLQSAIGSGAKSTISRSARQVQRALGMVQIALAFALLAGSLTLSVSLRWFIDRPLGFQPDHRIVAQVLAPKTVDMATAMGPAITGLRQLPSVVSATGVGFSTLPFSHSTASLPARLVTPGAAATSFINTSLAGPDYFTTLGIRILRGRALDPLDQQRASKVLVIGAGAARRLFGSTNVVGRSLQLPMMGDFRIVGVAAPVIWRSAAWRRRVGTMYVPVTAFVIKSYPIYIADFIIRLRPHIHGMDGRIKALVEAAIPGAVVDSVRSYRDVIGRFIGFRRLAASIVAVFAGLALVLAGLGVYAVNAYIARARLPEFGMRAMLGASPRRLLHLALGEAAWLLVFGLAGGMFGGFLLVRAMAPLLFHVKQIAPIMFAVAFVVIAAIMIGAAWRPASLAARMKVKKLLDAE